MPQFAWFSGASAFGSWCGLILVGRKRKRAGTGYALARGALAARGCDRRGLVALAQLNTYSAALSLIYVKSCRVFAGTRA